MEDTPLVLEHEAADKKSRRRKDNPENLENPKARAKKPEAIGNLAVEQKPRQRPAATAEKDESHRSPGHIGHMLITSETVPLVTGKKQAETLPAELLTGKRIDTLNRAELMAAGEKIVIDGSNLRQMYETHLIGERGVRRLVAEHLRGGDLRDILRQEVMEREMDFERDPVLRDVTLPSAASANASDATIETLLQEAAVSVADSGEEAAFFKARATYETDHQDRQHRQQRRLVDISLAFIITILVILVIFMYLTRR